MKNYWPIAVVVNRDTAAKHSTEKAWTAFTYDACFTLERAKLCIDRWADMFAVVTAWVEEEEDDTRTVVYLENNLNSAGFIRPHEQLVKEGK